MVESTSLNWFISFSLDSFYFSLQVYICACVGVCVSVCHEHENTHQSRFGKRLRPKCKRARESAWEKEGGRESKRERMVQIKSERDQTRGRNYSSSPGLFKTFLKGSFCTPPHTLFGIESRECVCVCVCVCVCTNGGGQRGGNTHR